MKEKITYELIEKLVNSNPNDYTLGKKVREVINSIKYPNDKEISNNRGDKN
jgi:hypothetical protein